MGLTIVGYFICATITTVVGIFIKRFYKKWIEQQNKHELYWLKVDCMIDALKKVNSGIGEKFASEYDKAFAFRKKDLDFINKN